MGYVEPSADFDAAVSELRQVIRDATKSATTFGYGPRFLHSTGQLHKGGPPTGRFLQLVHDSAPDVDIPEADYGFTRLKHAQAIGDLETLRAHDLPAARGHARGRRSGRGAAGPDRAPEGARVSAVAERAENPLIEGLERLPVHPTTLVIFGATGDLAKRKLLPALYNLAHEGALPERFNLVGVSRSDHAARGVPRRRRRRPSRSSRGASPTRPCSTSSSTRSATCRGPSTTRRSTRRWASTLDEFDKAAGVPHEPLLLPVDRADVLPGHRGPARRAQAVPRTRAPTCASSSRSRSGRRWPRPSSSTARCCPSSTSSRSSASTITWARRPSRTSWRSGSPTGCSSPFGTATTSIRSRSRQRRTSGSARGRATTTRPAPCAT